MSHTCPTYLVPGTVFPYLLRFNLQPGTWLRSTVIRTLHTVLYFTSYWYLVRCVLYRPLVEADLQTSKKIHLDEKNEKDTIIEPSGCFTCLVHVLYWILKDTYSIITIIKHNEQEHSIEINPRFKMH